MQQIVDCDIGQVQAAKPIVGIRIDFATTGNRGLDASQEQIDARAQVRQRTIGHRRLIWRTLILRPGWSARAGLGDLVR